MRKLKIYLLLVCSSLVIKYSNGQYAFDHYKVLSDTTKSYKMVYFVDKKEIYIHAYSNDISQDNYTGFIIQEKHLPNFIDQMHEIKNKYIEWKKIAIAQDVKTFEKELPQSIVTNIFFKDNNGKTSVLDDVKMKFVFHVKQTGDYKTINLKMYSGKIKLTEYTDKEGKKDFKWSGEYQTIPIAKGLKFLTAISDATKTSNVIQELNGFFITFFEETEIDNFVSKITLERLNEVKKIKGQIDDKKKMEKAKESLFN